MTDPLLPSDSRDIWFVPPKRNKQNDWKDKKYGPLGYQERKSETRFYKSSSLVKFILVRCGRGDFGGPFCWTFHRKKKLLPPGTFSWFPFIYRLPPSHLPFIDGHFFFVLR